jgi:A/G-specific adenine glycosylase
VERWPGPASLAARPPADAVRAWGRLGYPRRALRLHSAAVAIVDRHGGQVPADRAALQALPGIGSYTSAAVAAFAFGQRHAVVDTNVRRVQARAVSGTALPAPSLTAGEVRLAESLLPPDEPDRAPVSPRWSVAVMELGALVCTARAPRCAECPVRSQCRWNASGRPVYQGPRRRGQAWDGTDRQARGRLMAVLRAAATPVDGAELASVWSDDRQRARCLDSLVADGLVEPLPHGRFRLPEVAS